MSTKRTSNFGFVALLGFVAVLSTACSQREVIHETVVEKPAGQGLPQYDGTIDGGGGNGTNGKPLESYIVDIAQQSSFEKILKSKIELIQRGIPALASDFLHLTRERRWFMLPVDLNKNPSVGLLPPWKLGTYFPTDQIAIQNMKEVWIDSGDFDLMKDEDQARLLLHELVMGVRLLNSSNNRLDLCLANASRTHLSRTQAFPDRFGEFDKQYKEQRRKCFADAKLDLEQPQKIELTKSDYANIRSLTATLFSHAENFDADELILWLKVNNFPDYTSFNPQQQIDSILAEK